MKNLFILSLIVLTASCENQTKVNLDKKPFEKSERTKESETTAKNISISKTDTLINDLKSEITEVKESKLTTDNQTEVVNIHDYILYKDFLKKYVSSNGRVNYAEIKKNETELNDLVMLFKSNFIDKSWTKNEQLSYWINTYNLFTIQLIIQNYPTTSITKISSKPWDIHFINLNGNKYSLNQIENEIIRKQFNEPRIHFALNCASKSCPILLNKPFTPQNLNSLLTEQTKRFLNDSSKNSFDSNSIQISSIFDWYKIDFDSQGGVINFINKYTTRNLESQKISFMEYSWELND
jgi:hypothetical protein